MIFVNVIKELNLRTTLIGALICFAMACAGPAKEEKDVEQTPEDRLEQQKMRRSLLFALIADSRIESLSEYIVANDMSAMFSTDPGPFLFFTPTNNAFEGLDTATLKLWSNKNNGIVKSLINKHLTRVDTLVADLSYYEGRNLQTLGGIQIKVIRDQDQFYLEDVKGKRALITTNPMRMDNGYIFYIDQLLHRP